MRNWFERIEHLDRGVGVNIRPVTGDYIATVSTLDPTELHKQLWQDIYPTFQKAQEEAYRHASLPYSELEGKSWLNK